MSASPERRSVQATNAPPAPSPAMELRPSVAASKLVGRWIPGSVANGESVSPSAGQPDAETPVASRCCANVCWNEPLRVSCQATKTPPAPSGTMPGALWLAVLGDTRAGHPAVSEPSDAKRTTHIVDTRKSDQAAKTPPAPSVAHATGSCPGVNCSRFPKFPELGQPATFTSLGIRRTTLTLSENRSRKVHA